MPQKTYTTKFSPGDTVWIMHQNKPVQAAIAQTFIQAAGRYSAPYPYQITYSFDIPGLQDFGIRHEEAVLTTKEELIASL
jgi:hypothetical protein